MDQNWQKVLLIFTHLGIQTFISSTVLFSVFSLRFVPKNLKKMFSRSELESWYARSGKNAFSSDIFRNSNSSFSETSFELFQQVLNWRSHATAWLLHWTISGFIPEIGTNYCIKISIDNCFPLKNGRILFQNHLLFVQSIFSGWLDENIAVRLCLLFWIPLQNETWSGLLLVQRCLVVWFEQNLLLAHEYF